MDDDVDPIVCQNILLDLIIGGGDYYNGDFRVLSFELVT